MSSAYEMNDQIMGGVMKGLEAVGSRLEERLNTIREEKLEGKRSQLLYDYGLYLAKRVDELEILNRQKDVLLAQNEALLRQANERTDTFRQISTDHAQYLDVVVTRLNKVEDILQRQSANSFALDAIRQVALEELQNIQDPAKSRLIDPVKQLEVFDNAWKQFMQTTNVRHGVPPPPVNRQPMTALPR